MTYDNVAVGNRIAADFTTGAAARRFGTKYAIWRQRINNGSGWRQMEDRGSPTASHMDHPHISLFDKGGWLQPGTTIASNMTGRPEAILREQPDELVRRTIREELRPGRTGNLTLNYNEKPMTPTEVARALRTYDFMCSP